VYQTDATEDLGGIGVSQGETWKVNRKLAVQRLLSKHHLLDMEGDLLLESISLVDAMASATSKSPKRTLTVDLAHAIRAVSLNMTTSVSFGRTFYNFSPEFFQDATQGEEEADNFSYADFSSREGFPWPKTPKIAEQFVKYQESIGFLRSILQEILDDHKQHDGSRLETSFVDAILHAQEQQMFEKSDTSAVSLMLDLMLAGSDSVSKSLSFLILLLAQHPAIQSDLHQELESVASNSDLSSLDALPLLDAVIHEALRLFPVAPLALPHVCTQDETIGKFPIKKGSVVVPNIWALHRDPDVWKFPTDFRPSRFLRDESLKNSPSFAPFGIGARNCVGKHLGLAQMKLVIGHIFQRFQIELEDPSAPIYDVMGLTLSPSPTKCIITLRPGVAATLLSPRA
jgi:cytochrome P450